MSEVPDSSRERRRHVRVQPLAELPATASLAIDRDITLRVVDVSVGGIGIWVQRGAVTWKVDEQHELELKLGEDAHTVPVSVRHMSADRTVIGLRFEEMDEASRTTINRYVSELAERGA